MTFYFIRSSTVQRKKWQSAKVSANFANAKTDIYIVI